MRLYRATTNEETGIPPGSCWTEDREMAVAYQDNPGFGGPVVREIEASGQVLDITGGSPLANFRCLAEALGYEDPDAMAHTWWGAGWLYPWQESQEVADRLAATDYDWLRYEDDYPLGAITLRKL